MFIPLRLFAFCYLVFQSFVFKTQVSPTIPNWAILDNINTISPVNNRDIQNGYYYILVEEQHNTLEKQSLFHYATKVTSEAGLSSASQIEFDFDPSYQNGKLHFIKIHRGNTIIDKTKTEEVKILHNENERSNGLLYGKKTVYVNLSDIRKGDVIEYCYSLVGYNKIYKGHFNKGFWCAFSVPVGRIKYKVFFEKNLDPVIHYKFCSLNPDIEISKTKNYTWILNNQKIITVQDGSPSWYDPYPQILISSFNDWSKVKNWFEDLFKVGSYDVTSLKEITDSIKTKFKVDTSKIITACVDFVQNQIRYSGNENGMYSHLPHPPDFVLKNRFGDCKDKSLLLVELMRHCGVKAYPAILSTTLKTRITEVKPSVQEFDHCITAIKYHSLLYFIDPTNYFQAGTFAQRNNTDYETSMVLDGSPNLFYKIPMDESGELNVDENFIINSNGDASLKATFTYKGLRADEMRYFIATRSLDEIQEAFQGVYKSYSEEIIVLDSVIVKDDIKDNILTTTENYLLKNFWVKKPKENFISKDFTPSALNEKIVYANEKNRKDPLKLIFPAKVRQKISITLLGGFDIEDKLFFENNKFFDYSYKHTLKKDGIELDYFFDSKMSFVNPDDYEFYKSKTDIINSNLVFSTNQKFSDEAVYSFNWLLALIILLTAILASFLSFQLYKKEFTTNYFPRYNAIGSWLVLVGIGVALNPVVLIIQIVRLYWDEFNLDYFTYFFQEDSPFYNPLKGYYNLSICILNICLIVFSILLIFLFFEKKSSFRYYYPFFKVFNLILLIFDLSINVYFYYDMNDEAMRKEVSSQQAAIFRIFIQGCIWIPYVWFSERSRHTFTNPKPESHAQVITVDQIFDKG